jgi:hypothetical protein
MANIIQILRSTVFGHRPIIGSQPVGAPYVNFADKQLGVMDPGLNPLDLIGVPFFSTSANYNIGQVVNYQGILYSALVTMAAGPWVPANWIRVTGKVDKAGDTMTGDLTINKSAPALIMNRTDSNYATINGQKGGLNRWTMQLGTSDAEGGSNVGSNFSLYRFNDAGVAIDTPFSIDRAGGHASFSQAPFSPKGFFDVNNINSIQQWISNGLNWSANGSGSWRMLWDNVNGSWSAGNTGYQKFGSGFIIQWGGGGGGPDAWVSFPVTFPNFVLFLAATSNPGPGVLANQALVIMPRGDYTTSACVWQCRNVSDGGNVSQHSAYYFWMAIGY